MSNLNYKEIRSASPIKCWEVASIVNDVVGAVFLWCGTMASEVSMLLIYCQSLGLLQVQTPTRIY